MFELNTFVRQNILSLKPYSSARDEFNGNEGVFLDANENPFGDLNRYPDPYQGELKRKLSLLKDSPVENIFIGNGSDEIIDVLFRIFCVPGKDKMIICPPTYGMYEVSANINDVGVIKIPLTKAFQLDLDAIMKSYAKLIFICSPNNPTGNILKEIDIVLNNFNGIVIVDEAYIDFNASAGSSINSASHIRFLKKYPNLVVMQTFSKAWGLAAARVGVAYASEEIIAFMNKVKPPYNVSSLNQQAALDALNDFQAFEQNMTEILVQKKYLLEELKSIPSVKFIYPSDANFLLVEVDDADKIYEELVKVQVITRNRNSVINNCIRITVGADHENKKLLQELRKLKA